MGAKGSKQRPEIYPKVEPEPTPTYQLFRITVAVRDTTDSGLYYMSHGSRPVAIEAIFDTPTTGFGASDLVGSFLFGDAVREVSTLANSMTFVLYNSKPLFLALSKFLNDKSLAFRGPGVLLKLQGQPFQLSNGYLKWKLAWERPGSVHPKENDSPDNFDPELLSKVHEPTVASAMQKSREIGTAVASHAFGEVVKAGGVDGVQESASAVLSESLQKMKKIKKTFAKAALKLSGDIPDTQDQRTKYATLSRQVESSLELLEPLIPDMRKVLAQN